MEITFCELKAKEVINVCDGESLGHIIDMVIDINTARITAIVVPATKTIWGIFKTCNDIYIPYNKICKIGKDVILVQLNLSNNENENIINILEKETETIQPNQKENTN